MNAQDGSVPDDLMVFPSSSNTADKALRDQLLRSALPDLQPQEGSPANTFTVSELQELQAALPNLNLRPRKDEEDAAFEDQKPPASSSCLKGNSNNVLDICGPWKAPEPSTLPTSAPPALDWHGAPRIAPNCSVAREFRERVRQGKFTGPTNAQCPGFLQCNLVVLPQGQAAFDFLLFCQRNPQACPLLEVCDVGSPVPLALAPTADLRTDCPKYAIYRNGKLEKEAFDVTDVWPKDSVAFLIGCSFSYDGALLNAGIPLRSAEQGKNVPMYLSSLKCRPAGSLRGNVVVSMKPIPALQIAKEVEITSKFPHAHGGPVCIGRSECIGIEPERLSQKPDWGDAVELRPDEVPVFHACGVTPQAVLMESNVPFAITHAAGHMFVTDMPSDMGGGL